MAVCLMQEIMAYNMHMVHENSYSFFRENFPGIRSILVPDIVLSCEPKMKKQERKDILLCFRNDIEKNITGEVLDNIEKMLENNSMTYKFTDTVVKKYIYKSRREKILKNKWNEFATAKLVITDRLHSILGFSWSQGENRNVLPTKVQQTHGVSF